MVVVVVGDDVVVVGVSVSKFYRSRFLPWTYIHWVICSVSWFPYSTSVSTVSSLQNPQVSTWEKCNFLFENCQSILSLISLQTEVSDFESLQTCYSLSEWIFI